MKRIRGKERDWKLNCGKIKIFFCAEHDELNRKMVRPEKQCDALVQQPKDKLCEFIFMNQEKECLEAEETRKEIDEEFSLDTRDECFDESEEEE